MSCVLICLCAVGRPCVRARARGRTLIIARVVKTDCFWQLAFTTRSPHIAEHDVRRGTALGPTGGLADAAPRQGPGAHSHIAAWLSKPPFPSFQPNRRPQRQTWGVNSSY